MDQLSLQISFNARARASGRLALLLALALSTAGVQAAQKKTTPAATPVRSNPDLNSSKATDRLEALEVEKKQRKLSGRQLKDKLKTESDPRVRHRLNQALAISDASDSASILMDSLKSDPDATVRQGAAQLLGNYIQSASVVQSLGDALSKDNALSVRYAAALSLGLSKSPTATAALVKSIGNADPNLRRQIAASLQHQNTKDSLRQLIKLQSDSDKSVRDMVKGDRP